MAISLGVYPIFRHTHMEDGIIPSFRGFQSRLFHVVSTGLKWFKHHQRQECTSLRLLRANVQDASWRQWVSSCSKNGMMVWWSQILRPHQAGRTTRPGRGVLASLKGIQGSEPQFKSWKFQRISTTGSPGMYRSIFG